MMKIDWNEVGYWILFMILLIFIGWLIVTGRAWK